VPVGFECATASLAVIAVLVQASRKKAGVDAIVAAMEFLGQCGIRPDAETMEVILITIFLICSLSCVLN
jgi:preprotein translocase subunit SecG